MRCKGPTQSCVNQQFNPQSESILDKYDAYTLSAIVDITDDSNHEPQIQPTVVSDDNAVINPLESNADGIFVRQQQLCAEPKIIDLISDDEEVGTQMDHALKTPDGLALRQKRKRNTTNPQTHKSLKKKRKISDAAGDEKPFKCEFCEYAGKYKCNLTAHTRTHTRPFGCKTCGTTFAQKSSLNAHTKTHSKKRQSFECYLCKKALHRKWHLVRHMQMHSSEKVCCLICRKSFSRLGLPLHMKWHGKQSNIAGVRSFECAHCLLGFPNKNAWESHGRQCKSKQYECHLCNWKFDQRKFSLKLHMRCKHTGDRPFNCTNCDKRFCGRSVLSNHMSRCVKNKQTMELNQ